MTEADFVVALEDALDTSLLVEHPDGTLAIAHRWPDAPSRAASRAPEPSRCTGGCSTR